MKKRLLTGLALFSCLALAGLLALVLLTHGSHLDREHFEVLQVRMTRDQVERVLGGAPRNECWYPVGVWVRREGGLRSARIEPGTPTARFFQNAAEDSEEAVWVGKVGLIAARFGDDGRLQEKYFSDVIPGCAADTWVGNPRGAR